MDDSTGTGGLASAVARPIDRRQALKRGAVVGGALLWTTPVVQALSVRVADAASVGSGLPSHGVAVVNCGDGNFAVKIDSGELDKVTGIGNQDAAQLNSKNIPGGWRQPTAQELAKFTSFGSAVYSGVTPAQEGMFISLPAGCVFVDGYAYTFDGSFIPSGPDPGCGDGDKYTNAFLSGQTVWFLVRCNEPTTGE